MTRGEIIFIDSKCAYCSTEFNGDMYPDGRGGDIIKRFENGYFKDFTYYERFVEMLNRKYYKYDDDNLIREKHCENHTIDITENYTDYIYVINESDKEWFILQHGQPVFLNPRSLAVVHYQEVEKILHRVIHEQTMPVWNDLSKEEFLEVIECLQEASDLQDQVNELFRKSRDNIISDFMNAASLQISHETSVLRLLKRLMTDRGEWISYFIYELDYGRKYKPGMITDQDGQDIDLGNAEKLYDFLLQERGWHQRQTAAE